MKEESKKAETSKNAKQINKQTNKQNSVDNTD